jgi:hypothetical protein
MLGFLINIEKQERRLSDGPETLTDVSIKGDIKELIRLQMVTDGRLWRQADSCCPCNR